jgi:hypothetical protein
MQDALQLLELAGEHQKRLFYSNFLKNNKVGEILCVNCDDSGDTYLFERWSVCNLDFIVASCLLSEDSLTVMGKNVSYLPIETFVDTKEGENAARFAKLAIDLKEKRGMTLDQYREEIESSGRDSSFLVYETFTRAQIEDRLPPGKKTIQGDRNSHIVVLERQKEIPNDLQQARLNEYVVGIPIEVLDLVNHEDEKVIEDFREKFLKMAPKHLGISTTLPFFCHTQLITPVIYAFPEREVDVERELGRK